MIEINTIRRKYASMPDSELAYFAINEGHKLTVEGLDLLNAELKRRKLDPGTFELIESGKNAIAETNDNINRSSLTFIFDQKENGKSNTEILEGLIELGMEESIAVQLLLNMEAIVKQRLTKAEMELLIGTAILSSGIAITFLPLSMPANRLTYIIAWCTILLGTLQFVKGWYNKSRFKKIIKNMAAENEIKV
jgi:hypothetical protein